jgi:beta-glucuronidase
VLTALVLSAVALPALAPGEAGLGPTAASADAATPPTQGALYSNGQTGRYLLDGQWLYRADPTDGGVSDGFWRGVASTDGWSPVTVPNAYNAGDYSQASMQGSVGWYRRDFTLPGGAFAPYVPAAYRRWIIRFESVNYRATVWLNGHQIGTHAGAYLPFEFDLRYLRSGVNRLVVRVDDRRGSGDLPPGPGGGWWNFGGILREVYLRAVQRVDIAQVQVRPLLPCPSCTATVEERILVRNPTGAAQTVALNGHYGSQPLSFGSQTIAPAATWTFTASVRIPHPRLWAPGSPHLYTATLTLADAHGRTLAGYSLQSGIRIIKVTPNGLLTINGRQVHLRGVAIHEQDATLGAAIDSADINRMIGWIRQVGATVIRAHYPLNPETEELADRDGILLWSEIPAYQEDNDDLRLASWIKRAEGVLRDNILTNQNHPSVMLWSIGNELPTPVTGAEANYIKVASALAHQLDPTRPVGMAISNWPGVACQPAYAPLDVIGDNEYFGWTDAGGGGDDDRDALSPFLNFFRSCYPTKALFITEFGFEGSRGGPVEERGTYAFQSNSLAFHLGVFASKPWLAGALYFTFQDFAASPGWSGRDPVPHPPFVEKGMVDLLGNHKPAFAVMSEIYRATGQIGGL